MQEEIHIFWFRRDLRLEDNAGLFHALHAGKMVLPIFIFDKSILDALENKNDRRVHFIHQALEKINRTLVEYGSSLLTLFDTPLEAFKKLTEQYKIGAVYTNHDYEPYALKRDEILSEFLLEKGISFQSFKDQVIFEKNEVLKSDGSPYTIFTPYSKVWKEKYKSESPKKYDSEKQIKHYLKTKPFELLQLEDIGFKNSDLIIPSMQVTANILEHYHEFRDIPGIEGTSHLGIHLRFGTISIRQLAETAIQKNEIFLNELIWREFFMSILYHYPKVVHESFKKKYEEIQWRNNEEEFKKWCEGKTGYPIVDAGMRQLNETGWMHNRVRMITASFLCKHLLIDWRWGEQYFANKLIDYELAANNGNWQWAAGCGCDAAPYFRIFNPESQTKKFDPEFKYIRKWVKDFQSASYPMPIVEHSMARERVLRKFKEALNK